MMELWLACYTEEEIAEAIGIGEDAVSKRLPELREKYRNTNGGKVGFLDDFDPPLYNVWKQQDKSKGVPVWCPSQVPGAVQTTDPPFKDHC
jgi:hypothetical protein